MLCLSNTKRHTRVHLRCVQWGGSIIREAWPVPAADTTLPLSSPLDQAHFWTPVTFTKTTQCQVPCFDKEEPCSGKHLTTLIIDIVCLSQSFIDRRFSWRKKNGMLSDRTIFVNYAVMNVKELKKLPITSVVGRPCLSLLLVTTMGEYTFTLYLLISAAHGPLVHCQCRLLLSDFPLSTWDEHSCTLV